MNRNSECDGCRAAVTRAYHELRRRDVPDRRAFETAADIFRWHHPEVLPSDARFIVAEWLDQSGAATQA